MNSGEVDSTLSLSYHPSPHTGPRFTWNMSATPIRSPIVGRVTEDAARSHVLPARYYTEPAVYEWEKENIFLKSWTYAGHVSQVAEPGDYFPCSVLDEPLIISRNGDGDLKAFYNVCAHRGMKIVDGSGHGKHLQCPYHSWIYNLDGKLVRARKTDNLPYFDRSTICLPPVRLSVVESMIFVNLDLEAEPIATTIGPMFRDISGFGIDPEQLKLVRQKQYRIEANWKVVVDNFLESYHAEVAHPAYCSYADFSRAWVETHEWYTLMGGPSSKESIADLKATGRFEVTENRYNWGFPNFAYLFYSGPPNLFVWELLPVGHDQTIFRRNSFFESEDDIDDQSEALDDQLTVEDIRLIEGVWQGMKSRGFTGFGRYVINDFETQRSEAAVHQFHRVCQRFYDAAGL